MSASERRAQLIKVSRRVFADKGYENTSVEELAENAGVSKPILYEHFGGKEGLHAVIVDREIEYVSTQITAAITQGSARERLEGAAVAFMRYVRDHPDGFRVLTHNAPLGRHKGISSLLSGVGERVAEVFAGEFKHAGFSPDLAPLYAQVLIGMVTFAGQWWMEEQSLPIEQVASHASAIAWVGLRNLPSEPHIVDV